MKGQHVKLGKSSVVVSIGMMAILWCCIVQTDAAAQPAPIEGINLTPMNGNVHNSSFVNKPLENSYTQKEVQDTIYHKKGIRILINPQTVKDPKEWTNTSNVANWALQKGGYVVFCMVDSNVVNGKPSTTVNEGHGDGRVDDVAAARNMWIKVAQTYEKNPNVFFEAFNEPFGYKDARAYISEMKAIIPDNATVKIPHDRIIIDGMGYASDVQKIKGLWNGLLGYHAYPTWIRDHSQRIQSNYSNLVQRDLAGVAHRTMVTEFGVNLQLEGADYNDSSNRDSHVQFLKGLDDAFNVLKPRGTFYYHGKNIANNNHSYWRGTESAKRKVDMVQTY